MLCLFYTVELSFFFFFQAEDGIRDPLCDWSSDVCSSDLGPAGLLLRRRRLASGAPPRLDHADGVAAVLAPTPALGLGHGVHKPKAFSSTCREGSPPRQGTSLGKPSSATAGTRPTSSATVTSAWRRTAETTSASVSRAGSSTFMVSWAAPARLASSTPSARRPGRPSAPDSRTRAAIARAV